ncbi:helix-turn-helix domain-containing protein [Salibacterium sp. K-3]
MDIITPAHIKEARQQNEEAVQYIVERFEPFIQQCLAQTRPQEREDLRQELRLSCIESIYSFQDKNIPGFFEFCRRLDVEKSGTEKPGGPPVR